MCPQKERKLEEIKSLRETPTHLSGLSLQSHSSAQIPPEGNAEKLRQAHRSENRPDQHDDSASPEPPQRPQDTSPGHLASRDPRGAGRSPARRPISAPPRAVLPPAANRTRGCPGRGARAGAVFWRSGRWYPRAPAELHPSRRGPAWPGPAQRGGRGDAEPGRAAPLLDGGWGAFAATRETQPQVGAAASAGRGERDATPGAPRQVRGGGRPRRRRGEAGRGRGPPAGSKMAPAPLGRRPASPPPVRERSPAALPGPGPRGGLSRSARLPEPFRAVRARPGK